MSAERIDVLAVMEFSASDLAVAQEAFDRHEKMAGLDKASTRLTEARAAVTELIERAEYLCRTGEGMIAFRAALAKCGGAS